MAAGSDIILSEEVEQALQLVAKSLNTDQWRPLGRELDFQTKDFNRMEREAIRNILEEEKLYLNMLETWYKRYNGDDWFEILEKAVRRIGRNDIAAELNRQADSIL